MMEMVFWTMSAGVSSRTIFVRLPVLVAVLRISDFLQYQRNIKYPSSNYFRGIFIGGLIFQNSFHGFLKT